jgi:hypothetical protein
MAWIDVCNTALIRIGEMPIDSLTEDTDAKAQKAQDACNSQYEEAIDEVLVMADWACARARKTVTVDATAPDFGYDYRYALPSSPYCLKVLEIDGDPEYKIEGRYILTDQETSINLVYTKRITDETELDPLLRRAIALKIAHDISRYLAPSESLRAAIMDELGDVLILARATNQAADYNTDEDENSSSTGNTEWIDAGR